MAQTGIIHGDGNIHIIKKNGNTKAIINAVREADKLGTGYVEDFAQTIQGSSAYQTCYKLHNFVYNNIPYREDPDGLQFVQSPGMLWNNRLKELGGTGEGGDCKSMSLFCASTLKLLGYEFYYRFVSQYTDMDYHHVYLIVRDGDTYIPLDCTIKDCGIEQPFAKHYDMPPANVAAPALSGYKKTARVGAGKIDFTNDPNPAGTVAALEADYWQNDVNYYIQNSQQIYKDVLQRCINGIGFAFANKPVQKNKLIKKFNETYPVLLQAANCLIYHYWNDKTLVSFYASRKGINNPPNIPFPADYAEKMNTSKVLFEAFKEIGVRDGDLLDLCSYGVFCMYGIPLDYMLYRCYCIQLYGQPFRPQNGVPYYDVKTATLIANGASLNDTLGLALCFPAQGGVGRPFGQPYWSVGGHIISNGADQGRISKFAVLNKRPGTVLPDGTIAPGNIANNGLGISEQAQAEALIIYNKWRKGHMVVLPSPKATIGQGKPSIGLDPVTIVTIVVSCIGAIATILGVVLSIVKTVQFNADKKKTPLPPQDFKWEYETIDGCYIGACTNPNGCSGCTTVKYCANGTVECNPDLGAANNQPAAGNFGSPNQSTLYTVGGVALMGGGFLMYSNSSS